MVGFLLLLAALRAGALAQPADPDLTLDVVLRRAAAYVEAYQNALRSVIAEERYRQSSVGRTRLLRSDLLVFGVPGSREPWVAFRDVIEVDGLPVADRQQRLEDLFLASPAITRALRRRLVAESARFNLGTIRRDMNVPTMALLLLGDSDQARVTFREAGEERTAEGDRWTVAFEEVTSPALIQLGDGRELFAKGLVSIDPTSGRVFMTDLRIRDSETRLEVDIRVRYARDDRLDILVPERMDERYVVRPPVTSSRLSVATIRVDAQATYSNFRRFGVGVDFSIAPPD